MLRHVLRLRTSSGEYVPWASETAVVDIGLKTKSGLIEALENSDRRLARQGYE